MRRFGRAESFEVTKAGKFGRLVSSSGVRG
jgi:hypothetical protein